MPRFFVQNSQITDNVVTLVGDDAHHISRSLRMAAGEHITVCDMQKTEYECELTAFLPDGVRAQVLSKRPSETEPFYAAHVFQALPKGEKLDSIIQKSVECGAASLTTFESERCVVHVKAEAEEKRVERRRRIALEAAKQSGRGVVPTVEPTVSFSAMLRLASACTVPLFCYEGEGTRPLSEVLRERLTPLMEQPCASAPTVSVVIGSEGGFSAAEAKQAVAAGMLPVGLGKRILRTETAASFVLACLSFATEMS